MFTLSEEQQHLLEMLFITFVVVQVKSTFNFKRDTIELAPPHLYKLNDHLELLCHSDNTVSLRFVDDNNELQELCRAHTKFVGVDFIKSYFEANQTDD